MADNMGVGEKEGNPIGLKESAPFLNLELGKHIKSSLIDALAESSGLPKGEVETRVEIANKVIIDSVQRVASKESTLSHGMTDEEKALALEYMTISLLPPNPDNMALFDHDHREVMSKADFAPLTNLGSRRVGSSRLEIYEIIDIVRGLLRGPSNNEKSNKPLTVPVLRNLMRKGSQIGDLVDVNVPHHDIEFSNYLGSNPEFAKEAMAGVAQFKDLVDKAVKKDSQSVAA
ncbi:MAG: hypothetical protein Q7R49_03685 [Candidatus Daviesbacteria bacterium]|nr:hypothetical protein [Candidatus Daviesbacteria bacterium]